MGETITPEELRKSIADKEKVTVIDVRRKADFEADSQVIPGAVHKDPEQVEEWSKDLGYGQDIVVYCVRGGSVSKSVSEKLRAR